MIVMFTYGIGMLLGSQISGALYNQLVAGQSVPQAWVTFWWIPAVAAAVIALIFLFSSSTVRKNSINYQEGMKTMKGPGIFWHSLSAPRRRLTPDGIAAWAAGLGYQALQIPCNHPAILMLNGRRRARPTAMTFAGGWRNMA